MAILKKIGLFDKIKKSVNLYYCLLTYNNPAFDKNILHHALFWKPLNHQISTTYWYHNENIGEKTGLLKRYGMEWGEFIEHILDKNISDQDRKDDIEIIDSFIEKYYQHIFLISFKI